MVLSGSNLIRAVSGILLLLLAVACVGAMDAGDGRLNWAVKQRQCSGSIGECFEEGEEMLMDSESNRRILASRTYISYGALSRDMVPCSKRGFAYYNCGNPSQANPYTRACTQISRCARDTS